MRLLDEIFSHQKVLQLGREGKAGCSRSSCCTREDEGRRVISSLPGAAQKMSAERRPRQPSNAP